jgi:4-hydroxybenzoate polyprenyltransferase
MKKLNGSGLLFGPALWGLCLGSPTGIPSMSNLLLFASGSYLTNSAGCVVNDMLD